MKEHQVIGYTSFILMSTRVKLSILLMFLLSIVHAEAQIRVSGTVTDSKTSKTIIGATVSVKGTSNVTITDFDGVYSLNVPDKSIIVVSYLGYEDSEKLVNNSSVLNFSLVEQADILKEVVIVGYGTQKKSNITSSISKVGSEVFESRPVTTAAQALQGSVPGLTIQQNSNEPGSGSNINIRGIGTFQSGTYPLVLVDGVIGSIDNINPNDIESVSVLKDASATAVYGSRAANGVILVTTKTGKSGKTQITYDRIYGIQQPTNMPKYAKAWEYAELRNEALINSGLPAKFTSDQISDFRSLGNGIVWLNEIYRNNAPQSSHNLSVQGGGDKTKYYLSL